MTSKAKDKSNYLLGFALLVIGSLIFGSTFPVMKAVVSSELSPQVLTTIRFTIGAVVLSPLLSNLNKSLIRYGIVIGLIFFGISLLEFLALEDLSASRAGVSFALGIVFVMFFDIFRGKSLSLFAIVSAMTAFSGIVLIGLQSGSPLINSVWIIIAALLDSAYIIIVERAVVVHSPLHLTAVSCWIPSILGSLLCFPEIVEEWSGVRGSIWGLLYLGIVAIAIATILETTGQKWVPSNEVAILRALEPLSAIALSFWFLGETFSGYDYIGSGMVLSSILLLILSTRSLKGIKSE